MLTIISIIGVLVLIILILSICFHKQIDLFASKLFGKARMQKRLYKACKLNDYLIINEIILPVNATQYKKIDTIIFGNKYIYIIKEIDEIGEIKIEMDDSKWRLISNKKLKLINNPFIDNRKIINNLVSVVNNLSEKNLKSVVVINHNSTYNEVKTNDNEYITFEYKAIDLIKQIEYNSNDPIIDSKEIERLCNAFYEQGLIAEKKVMEKEE